VWPTQGLAMSGKPGFMNEVDSHEAARLAASSQIVRVSEQAASKSSGAVGLDSTLP
jgi:hypothetical protein